MRTKRTTWPCVAPNSGARPSPACDTVSFDPKDVIVNAYGQGNFTLGPPKPWHEMMPMEEKMAHKAVLEDLASM